MFSEFRLILCYPPSSSHQFRDTPDGRVRSFPRTDVLIRLLNPNVFHLGHIHSCLGYKSRWFANAVAGLPPSILPTKVFQLYLQRF